MKTNMICNKHNMAELIELYHKNQEILMLKLGFGAISIA
jgi:hypothetical protein